MKTALTWLEEPVDPKAFDDVVVGRIICSDCARRFDPCPDASAVQQWQAHHRQTTCSAAWWRIGW